MFFNVHHTDPDGNVDSMTVKSHPFKSKYLDITVETGKPDEGWSERGNIILYKEEVKKLVSTMQTWLTGIGGD